EAGATLDAPCGAAHSVRGQESGMAERKKVSNVAVRVPTVDRALLTDGGRLPLTPVVEGLLARAVDELAELPLTPVPDDAERTYLSLERDLTDQLRQVARRRCTTVGALVYS